MRIGIGSDIHRLVEGRQLIIAGVVIPSPVGELAHSDGDVLYHALSDAILGALALGDIGVFFPDSSDETFRMDSSEIRSVCDLAKRLFPGARVLAVGPHMTAAAQDAGLDCTAFPSAQAAAEASIQIEAGSLVFLKASRSTHLELLEPAGA